MLSQLIRLYYHYNTGKGLTITINMLTTKTSDIYQS